MYKLLSAALAGLLLTACATTDGASSASMGQSAPAPAAPAATAVANAEEDPNEEVCRRVQQTGTRFHSRVCMTRAEWAEQSRQATDSTDRMQRTVEPNTGPN